MMAINRRTFLLTGLALGAVPRRLLAQAHPLQRAYLSCRGDDAELFYVSGFTADGTVLFDLPLPARGHALTVHPQHAHAVVFARRPGTFAQVIDINRGVLLRELAAVAGRHYCGHGVFTADGSLLYVTENDYENERGIIGIYAVADNYRRIGEWHTHGIDPHDVRLLPDGVTLVVANGGIITHPDFPRVKLNIATMSPSLVYLDRRDGRLLSQVQLAPELHQLSIRHLAIGQDNTVAIALQYEGPEGDAVPLVALHRAGQAALTLCTAPATAWRSMRQYGGSVAFDRRATVLAVSSPRGGVIGFWDTAGRYRRSVALADGCGVAPTARPGEFLASSGLGGVIRIDGHSGTTEPVNAEFLATGYWDNHLVSVL